MPPPKPHGDTIPVDPATDASAYTISHIPVDQIIVVDPQTGGPERANKHHHWYASANAGAGGQPPDPSALHPGGGYNAPLIVCGLLLCLGAWLAVHLYKIGRKDPLMLKNLLWGSLAEAERTLARVFRRNTGRFPDPAPGQIPIGLMSSQAYKEMQEDREAAYQQKEALRKKQRAYQEAQMAEQQKYGQAFRQMVEGSVTRHAKAQSKGVFAAWCDAQRLTVETNLETRVAAQIQRKADNYESVKQAMARAVYADARLVQIEQQVLHDERMSEIRRIQEVRDGAQAARALPAAGYAALPAASPPPLPAIAAPSNVAGDPALTEQVAVAAVLIAEENGQAATSAAFAAFFQDIAPKLRADMPALDLSLVLARAQEMRRQAYPGT